MNEQPANTTINVEKHAPRRSGLWLLLGMIIGLIVGVLLTALFFLFSSTLGVFVNTDDVSITTDTVDGQRRINIVEKQAE